MTTPFDTQKIRIGLLADLAQAEKELKKKWTLDKFQQVRHLRAKVEFYETVDTKKYQSDGGLEVAKKRMEQS